MRWPVFILPDELEIESVLLIFEIVQGEKKECLFDDGRTGNIL